MPLKALLDKGAGHHAGLMHQQLRFDPMDPRRLLQGLNHMQKQSRFHVVGIARRPLLATKRSPITPLLPS